MNQVNQAKQIPIEDFLFSRGYKPVRQNTGKYLRYLSMLHNEKEASFYINKANNKWKDFGMPGTKWDDVIGLVRTIDDCSFTEALERLLNIKIVKSRRVTNEEYKPGIEIVNTSPLKASVLIEYLSSRGVDIDIARLYCTEALVRFPNSTSNPNKEHLYIAFRNDKGGYELRNQYKSKIGKVSSSPKYFTRIEGDPEKYNLFEGFIDFLTMLTKYKVQQFKNTTVILNSLVNLLYLYETLKSNEENNVFFDNDEAADKYIWKGDPKMKIVSLKEQGIIYTDRRDMFALANDINDLANGKIYI